MKYQVDNEGFFGEFGGAYIPEMLVPNITELSAKYVDIINSESFQTEFKELLQDYAGRPSSLYFAKRLSESCGYKVYLKREDLNHTGSHKINNTLGQILLAKRLGRTRIIAETGAGQHGVATATVSALMGLECVVYMGAVDVQRQAPNVERMKMLGATVVPVHSGSKTLKDATNEALRDWIAHPVDTHYIIGSVVGPHPFPDMVARFQSVISEEISSQLNEKRGNPNPDFVIACVGGGSNALGSFFHYLDVPQVGLIGVEAAGRGLDSGLSAATTALGSPGVLHGARTLLMQTSDGQIVEAHSISAGLDYPGIGPQHAHLHSSRRVLYASVTDQEALEAAIHLAKTEGIIPALESAHALAYLKKLKANPGSTVVVCLSGRGDKDMGTYAQWIETQALSDAHVPAAENVGRRAGLSLTAASTKSGNSRIADALKVQGQLLSIYLTAGFPKLDSAIEICQALEDSGVGMIELGFPFSDPLADGPTIQASSEVALKNGMTLGLVLEQLEKIRRKISIPILLMGYLNPILRYGFESFVKDASQAGADGMILPDLPLEEYLRHYKPLFNEHNIANVLLVTPQTPDERVRLLDLETDQFLYAVSSQAVTGAQADTLTFSSEYFKRLQGLSLSHPLIVGFGINNRNTFRRATQFAKGAIIGSAYLRAIGDAHDISQRTREFVNEIISG